MITVSGEGEAGVEREEEGAVEAEGRPSSLVSIATASSSNDDVSDSLIVLLGGVLVSDLRVVDDEVVVVVVEVGVVVTV